MRERFVRSPDDVSAIGRSIVILHQGPALQAPVSGRMLELQSRLGTPLLAAELRGRMRLYALENLNRTSSGFRLCYGAFRLLRL